MLLLLQSTSLSSKKLTARHLLRNTSEAAKHHLISCRKCRKISRNKRLPGGRNNPISNPILTAAAAGGCCCWCWCCCWWRRLLLLPCLLTGCWLLRLVVVVMRNSKTPSDVVPKVPQNQPQKLPNVWSVSLRKIIIEILPTINLSLVQAATADRCETAKHHLISAPKIGCCCCCGCWLLVVDC